MRNTALTLQYRDGDNFKFYSTIVLPGEMPADYEAQFSAACEQFDGEPQFEPAVFKLPAPFPWTAGAHLTNPATPFCRSEADHDFCTVIAFESTNAVAGASLPSPLELVQKLQARYHADPVVTRY